MAWKRNILVVANVTATSPELLEALVARAQQEPAKFTLIVPATPFGGGRAAAVEQLADALAELEAAGLEVAGAIGDGDPLVAVSETWDPKSHDEIVVSTLPMSMSKWLHAGLPQRIGRLTGAHITHIVCQPPKPAVDARPLPPHQDPGAGLGPLKVLAWGPHKR